MINFRPVPIDIDLVIFDLDGTLIDSRKDIVSAINFTLQSLGLPPKTFQEGVACIGGGIRDLLQKCMGEVSQETLEKGMDIFSHYFSRHFNENSSLYPGVKEILDYLQKKGKQLLILTNRLGKEAELSLDALGIGRYFKGIIAGDDEECLKPSACPLRKALEKVRVEKERSLMVGDMHYDILAGKEAGVFTCGVTYGIGSKQEIIQAKPDFIIDEISELREILG